MADTYLNQLLGEGEQIILVTRRHWLVLLGEILSESVLTVALAVLISLLLALLPVTFPWLVLGYLLLLLPILSLGRDLAIWLNNKFVVTNRRIIHVEGVLDKDITDSSLEKVNDVKLEQSVWGRLLNYGNVEILTASELGVNKFNTIADPIRFKTAMLNAKNRLDHPAQAVMAPAAARAKASPGSLADRMNEQRVPPAAAPDVATLLLQLDQLRQAGVLTESEFQNKKAQLLARM
jgi:uncharacterized membrane protein YdbT with pleckstrin-like domain